MSAGRSQILPPAPRPGDTLAVVAPASNITPEALERGCSQLQRFGFKTVFLDSILDQDLYFAGSAVRRARELEAMFRRDDVAGMVCARGGYGCNYLLPLIDLEVIRAHPKFFMGYSDITTLLTWLHDQTGLITYHGPMVAKDFADGHPWPDVSGRIESDAQTLRDGKTTGALYGGCLSMLVASLGTPYEVQTKGTILCIEDVNTKPFQIDRMLMQLKFAGKLEGVRGFIFGKMLDCVQPGSQGYTLQEVILRILAPYEVPIAFGLSFGHLSTPPNLVLPVGMLASLTVADGRIQLSPA